MKRNIGLKVITSLLLLTGFAVHDNKVIHAEVNPQDGKGIENCSGAVCLNGNAVILTEGSSENLTKIYLDKNANGLLDGEDELVSLSVGNDIYGDSENGYTLSEASIYGIGTWSSFSPHEGDIIITMTGGKVKKLQGSLVPANTGDLKITMSGGSTKLIMTSGVSSWNGDISIHITGDAKVTQELYAGAENSDVTINGLVNIRVSENASVNAIHPSGQQPMNIFTENVTIQVDGGTVTEGIRPCFATTFNGNLTYNLNGGVINNYVALGVSDSEDITTFQKGIINANGSTINGSIIGETGTDNARNCDGNSIEINMKDGSAKGIVGKVTPGTMNECIIQLTGGLIENKVTVRQDPTIAMPTTSEIRISKYPKFSTSGYIYLGENEVAVMNGALNQNAKIIINADKNETGTKLVKNSGSDYLSYTVAKQFVLQTALPNTKLDYNENEKQLIIRSTLNDKTITFDYNYDSIIDYRDVEMSATTTLPTPSRTGFQFTGWSDGVQTYPGGTVYTMPNDDVLLKAQWMEKPSTPSSSYSPSNQGFVDRHEDTYFYQKGKKLTNSFLVIDDEELVKKVATSEYAELKGNDKPAYFAKPNGKLAKYEWIILDQNGQFVDAVSVGDFAKQYGKEYKVYLADENGKLVKSWQDTEGNWYYFNDDYTAKCDSWQAHYDEWYYFSNYEIKKNSWVAADHGRWYYLGSEGKMVINQRIDGCYINEFGIYWSPLFSDPEYVANYQK